MLHSGQIIEEVRYDSNHVRCWYWKRTRSLWLLRGSDALTREETWWQSTAVLARGFASAMALMWLNCQKVSPRFWEGMFAIYFPLLTELLKYTKLGYTEGESHRQWSAVERQTIGQILGIRELVEPCSEYCNGWGLAHFALSLSSPLYIRPCSQKEKTCLMCTHFCRCFIFFMSK